MKKLLLGTAATFFVASSPAMAQSSFEGPYVGMSIGMATGNADSYFERWAYGNDFGYLDGWFNTPMDGTVMGGQLGYNFVAPSGVVFGVELASLSGQISGTREDYGWEDSYYEYGYDDQIYFGDNGSDYSCCGDDGMFVEDSIETKMLFQGRAGMTTGNTLFYATAGLAMGELNRYTEVWSFGPDDGYWLHTQEYSKAMTGITYGLGVEQMINDRVSIGASWSRVDYSAFTNSGTADYAASSGSGSGGGTVLAGGYDEVTATSDIFKLNLNIHF